MIQGWILWLEIALTSIGIVIGLILIIIHAYHMLRMKNKNTTTATSLLSFTVNASIICYWLGIVAILPTYFSEILFNPEYCPTIWFIGSVHYFLARMFTYQAFIIRLYIVYKGSLYQYNTKLLVFVSVTTILFAIGVQFSGFYVVMPNMIIDESHDYKITTCAPDPIVTPKYAFGIVILYDIGFSIGGMIAFINPLRKMINATKSDHTKNITKLIASGMKCAILVTVASLTTIMLVIFVASGTNLFHTIDHITNIICIMLMTRYYRNKNYYSRLCCGAIKCSKWCMGCCCCYKQNEEVDKLTEIVTAATTSPKDTAVTV